MRMVFNEYPLLKELRWKPTNEIYVHKPLSPLNSLLHIEERAVSPSDISWPHQIVLTDSVLSETGAGSRPPFSPRMLAVYTL